MDETIDLRPYVDSILQRWWVILGAVTASILLAVFLYFSQSHYQAAALIAIIDPSQRLQFDLRLVSALNLDDLVQVYPELATSDDVLLAVLDQVRELPEEAVTTLPQLRSMVNVETGSDSRLMRLIVRSDDPQLAADVANIWANTFVNIVDKIYLGRSGEIDFYENLFADTNTELQKVEQALVEFQSSSRLSIVDNQLLSLNEEQASNLADRRRLDSLLGDIHALQDQIMAGTSDTVTWADQLTALTLQIKAFETTSVTPVPSESIQLLVNPEVDLTTSNRAEHLILLDNLAQTVEAGLVEIELRLSGLEPRFFELQREKETLTHQYERLTHMREVTTETVLTLARKVDEVRIQSEDTGSSLRIASLAAYPTRLERPNLTIMVAIAGLAGLLISIATIILYTWWKYPNNQSDG
jgi:uncharacterized protein involved in exopolysaccharide biosynthesis